MNQDIQHLLSQLHDEYDLLVEFQLDREIQQLHKFQVMMMNDRLELVN
jgi:hypothetical protein